VVRGIVVVREFHSKAKCIEWVKAYGKGRR
jgi:hypothetical protein